MKLYKTNVSIEFELIVTSDDGPPDAMELKKFALEELSENGIFGNASYTLNGPDLVTGTDEIGGDWVDTVPWGGNGDKTCREILEDDDA